MLPYCKSDLTSIPATFTSLSSNTLSLGWEDFNQPPTLCGLCWYTFSKQLSLLPTWLMEGGRELSGNHTSDTRLIVSSDSGLFCGVSFVFGMGRSVKWGKGHLVSGIKSNIWKCWEIKLKLWPRIRLVHCNRITNTEVKMEWEEE